MRKILLLILIVVGIFSCKIDTKTVVDVSNIPVSFSLSRFDVDFYTSSKNDLPKLKNKYPLLFPNQVEDSVWIHKITNKDEQELFAETQKIFNDFSSEEKELKKLFQYIKYYNPKFVSPNVITMLTNIDYNNRVIYADSLLLISLDAYLGKEHEFYNSYPNYIKQNNHKKHLIVDVANSIIKKQVLSTSDRTFLAKMINQGKKMYLLDAYLPSVSDQEKIGYSLEKMNWALVNQEQIWKFFIENDLLYSTDTKLNKRFLDVAPFSKFYLADDNKSPGQIGVWIGCQIVRSYMQNNDVSLPELLQTDAETIFKKSNYKPRR